MQLDPITHILLSCIGEIGSIGFNDLNVAGYLAVGFRYIIPVVPCNAPLEGIYTAMKHLFNVRGMPQSVQGNGGALRIWTEFKSCTSQLSELIL